MSSALGPWANGCRPKPVFLPDTACPCILVGCHSSDRACLSFPSNLLPSLAKTPQTGPDWIHEINHDGFRVLARRDGKKVRLISRKGKDLTYRFPLAVQAVAALPVHSCLIDGEAIISDASGLAIFNGPRATLCAFDLIEIDGEDCAGGRSKTARLRSRNYCAHRILALPSKSTSMSRERSCFIMLASSAARASCRSGSARQVGFGTIS